MKTVKKFESPYSDAKNMKNYSAPFIALFIPVYYCVQVCGPKSCKSSSYMLRL